MPKYFCWTKHGQKGVMMEDNEEVDYDNNFSIHAGLGAFDDDTAMEEPEADAAENEPTNDLGQALRDAREDCDSEKEGMKFQQMLEDHCKLLYPGCEDGLKKLGTCWSCCNGRQHMVYQTWDLVSY